MNSLCFHAYSIFINIRGDIIGGRRKTAQNTVELHWERILLKIFWTSVNSDSDCICPGKRPNFKKKTILSVACSPLHLRLDSPCSITFDPRYLYLLRHTINRHSSAKSTCPLAKMFVMNVNACSYKVRQMWLDISTIYWTLDVKKVDISKIFWNRYFPCAVHRWCRYNIQRFAVVKVELPKLTIGYWQIQPLTILTLG